MDRQTVSMHSSSQKSRINWRDDDNPSLRTDKKSSTVLRDKPVKFLNLIPSPYDARGKARRCKTVFPNRVYTPWYRKYMSILPADEYIDFQPFDEVQTVDEDIALQYFYGEDGNLADPNDRHALEKRKAAFRRYQKVREQQDRDKVKAETNQSDKTRELEFGATQVQKKIYLPIIEFFHKLHTSKMRALCRVVLKPDSKWKLLKDPRFLQKLAKLYKQIIQEQIHARFRKIIRLVVAVIRFIESIHVISGSTKHIMKELANFKAMQRRDSKRFMSMTRRKIFDAQKYYVSKELHIPFCVRMTLTKPWFTRTDSEVDQVIATLQSYKSFVQYPPVFQRRLATLAWYIEAEADKYIIRERHLACDFYILLKGKAKVLKMVGDPYIFANGHLELIRYVKKSDGFGDESMSDPESQREYSVVSCEPCSLLAVNVHDYLQMLNTRKEYEFAPEHIIFLSNIKIMKDFPKLKLIEEGNENITIHYFRAETIISKNLSDSKYVFVIMNTIASHEQIPISRALKSLTSKRKFKPVFPDINLANIPVEATMSISTNLSINEYEGKIRNVMRTLPKPMRDNLYYEVLPTIVSNQTSQQPSEIFRITSRDEITNARSTTSNRYHQYLSSVSLTGFDNPMVKSVTSLKNHDAMSEDNVKQCSSVCIAPRRLESTGPISIKSGSSGESVPFYASQEFLQQLEHEESPPIKEVKNIKKTVKNENNPILASRWSHVRSLNRGDYVGQEWLDYNNGEYDPPTVVMSLVSNGCESIMVKRSLLLKYLRKEW